MESRRGRYIEYFGDWQSQRRNNMNYPVLEIFDVVELRDGRLAVVLPVSEELDEKGLGLYSRAYTYIPRIVYAVNYNDYISSVDSAHITLDFNTGEFVNKVIY